jgi:FkbM family methyltransferase
MFKAVDLWSCGYRIATNKRTTRFGEWLSNPLRLMVRLARKFHHDPTVRVPISGKPLLIPWSHNLPQILADFPYYESEIGRLAAYLHRIDDHLCMIDIGANIGDTLAILPPLKRSRFLCVEGSQRYFDLLRRNYVGDRRVTPVLALLGDGTVQAAAGRVVETGGTGHVCHAASNSPVDWKSLDQLLNEHAEFKRANFLKIDTDGYDLHVLHGATSLLQDAHPCLHIEFSPRHWRDYGGNTVQEGLEFLAAFDYRQMIIYDNQGVLIDRDTTSTPRFIPLLTDYALRKPGFYLNIVAFHSSRTDADVFYRDELAAPPIRAAK